MRDQIHCERHDVALAASLASDRTLTALIEVLTKTETDKVVVSVSFGDALSLLTLEDLPWVSMERQIEMDLTAISQLEENLFIAEGIPA